MELKNTPKKTKQNFKKNKARDITLLNFKLCYKAILTKILWCWHKNTQVNEIQQQAQK